MVTITLGLEDVDLVYGVHGPLPAEDGRPPLVLIGQPMVASGFSALIAEMPDRTTVSYDPRGLGRSTRRDDRVDHDPRIQAGDVRAIIDALGVGPVDVFASSGGAVTALALVAAHGSAVHTVVAHEPPMLSLLPDAEAAVRSQDLVRERYEADGFGAGMAAFIAQGAWEGEFDDALFAQPTPDPAEFGLPTDDDGARDDPLMSDRSLPITRYQPDVTAIKAAPTRVVIAVGEESINTVTGRCAVATAAVLGQPATVFPSHHGGFMGGEFGYVGQPQAFAARLRDVLKRELNQQDTSEDRQRRADHVGIRKRRPLLPPGASGIAGSSRAGPSVAQIAGSGRTGTYQMPRKPAHRALEDAR